MIPEKRGDINQVSDLDGETIAFTLDDDPEHLMSILTNIYADPETAVIREYTTNAWDSHIDADIKRPVEVTTPSALQPNLVIQDFGVGLDIEDMRRVYTKYGASTKRESNKVVGMLGIGSKSALALVDQFSVVSIKGGEKIQASVAQNENGAPELIVVSRKNTDEENGVQIIIPAKRSSSLEDKAKELFKYWPKNSVLLNGKEPPKIIDKGTKLNDKLQIIDDSTAYYNRNNNRHTLVMGNVPYPLELKEILAYGKKLIVWADIGSIHFAPDREEMADTKMTREYVDSVTKELEAEIVKHLENATKNIKNSWEVIPAIREASSLVADGFYHNEFEWNGKKIPEKYQVDDPFHNENKQFYMTSQNNYSQRTYANKTWTIHSSMWNNYYYIENFNLKKFNKIHGEKLNAWYESIGGDLSVKKPNFVLFPEKVPDEIREWINPDTIIDWKEDVLPAAREVKVSNSKPKDTYDSIINGIYSDRGVTSEELDKAKHAFWFYRPRQSDENYDFQLNKVKRVITVLRASYPNAKFALVEANRLTRLQTLVPGIQKGDSGLRDLYDKWKTSLTDDEFTAIYGTIAEESVVQTLTNIINKINISDPEVKEITKKYAKIKKIRKDKSELVREKDAWYRLGYIENKEINYGEKILEKYPLLETNPYRVPENYADEIEIYINAKYKATL